MKVLLDVYLPAHPVTIAIIILLFLVLLATIIISACDFDDFKERRREKKEMEKRYKKAMKDKEADWKKEALAPPFLMNYLQKIIYVKVNYCLVFDFFQFIIN